MDNLSLLYKLALIIGAIANLFMAASLLAGQKPYRKYVIYSRARQFTILWLAAFALGYLIHAFLELRVIWPTAATAVTVSYFHIGAICFCWGYIPLLNPDYLTRRIAVRDTVIYAIELISCWTMAFIWKEQNIYTALPFLLFFGYCAYNVVIFYKTFHRVSFRLLMMSYGNVRGFVRWMQLSCDIIIFFGIFLVALVLLFPNAIRLFTPIEAIAGIGLFAYIVRSISRYGKVVEDATRATENVAEFNKK
ncbi:MAG: hypothetical protein J5759_02725 [Bacteroidales bacterium]|nr:hypothetical protein [Bacteroidales bacterium]